MKGRRMPPTITSSPLSSPDRPLRDYKVAPLGLGISKSNVLGGKDLNIIHEQGRHYEVHGESSKGALKRQYKEVEDENHHGHGRGDRAHGPGLVVNTSSKRGRAATPIYEDEASNVLNTVEQSTEVDGDGENNESYRSTSFLTYGDTTDGISTPGASTAPTTVTIPALDYFEAQEEEEDEKEISIDGRSDDRSGGPSVLFSERDRSRRAHDDGDATELVGSDDPDGGAESTEDDAEIGEEVEEEGDYDDDEADPNAADDRDYNEHDVVDEEGSLYLGRTAIQWNEEWNQERQERLQRVQAAEATEELDSGEQEDEDSAIDDGDANSISPGRVELSRPNEGEGSVQAHASVRTAGLALVEEDQYKPQSDDAGPSSPLPSQEAVSDIQSQEEPTPCRLEEEDEEQDDQDQERDWDAEEAIYNAEFGTPDASPLLNFPRTTREYLEAMCEVRSPCWSYHSGDTDDFAMEHRPVLQRAAIKYDIKAFCAGVYQLRAPIGLQEYQVVDRLGEGTFSSVYLAYDRQHGKWNNDWWTGVPDTNKVNKINSFQHDKKVALKRILATSSPLRIENELEILESLRGCRNISQLITAFRDEDQVIVVLPYHQSDDFRHFYRLMDTAHIRAYMKCILQALADCHGRGIIHRDVKPANFLFDYESSTGVLCDFGLAERYQPPKRPTCQHGPATLEALGGTRVTTVETPRVEQAVYDARKRARVGEGRVGFAEDDRRPGIKTNRAGTRGFRAPEVLLKCPDQTSAIDVWSVGIMLLSVLCHKFPIFNSSDDIEALMEISAMFGRAAMERCAALHNRTIMSNAHTLDTAPASLSHIILRLNPHIYTPHMSRPTSQDAKNHIRAIDAAIDLCGRMLRLDCTKRISSAAALNHAFFHGDPDFIPEPEDAPLLGTEGKCGHLHQIEDGKHRAFFQEQITSFEFGQGIPPAIDRMCPEHEHWQQRSQVNPIRISRHFTTEEEVEA